MQKPDSVETCEAIDCAKSQEDKLPSRRNCVTTSRMLRTTRRGWRNDFLSPTSPSKSIRLPVIAEEEGGGKSSFEQPA